MSVPISFVTGILDMVPDEGPPIRKDLPPGSAMWLGRYGGPEDAVGALDFICPCGCGTVHAIRIRPCEDRPSWEWDGNRDKPTLKPSIQCNTPCKWHGYLTAGVFEPC
jgi:hypothetical protein